MDRTSRGGRQQLQQHRRCSGQAVTATGNLDSDAAESAQALAADPEPQ